MIYICHIVAVSNPVVDIGPENRIIASKGAGKVQAVPVLPCDVGQVYLETKYWSLNYVFLNAVLPCQQSPVDQDVLRHKSGFPLEHTCQIWIKLSLCPRSFLAETNVFGSDLSSNQLSRKSASSCWESTPEYVAWCFPTLEMNNSAWISNINCSHTGAESRVG